MSRYVKPHILNMKPYSPGKPIADVKREFGISEVVKLASNENPFGPSPKAVQAAAKCLSESNLYPDGYCYELRTALAKKHHVDADMLLFGNGSDEIIHYLGVACLPDGTELMTGYPTFMQYAAAAMLADVTLVSVPTINWTFDVKAMAEQLSEKTRLVLIPNPNNPTGTYIKQHEMEYLIGKLPAGAMLVMDEAYWEYAQDAPDYPDSIAMVKSGAPVMVLRTFSKAYGLAGLRIGYGIASSDMVGSLNRIREPFNVNSVAQTSALAALGDTEFIDMVLKSNKSMLRFLEIECESLGLETIPSVANSIMIRVGSRANDIFHALMRQGYIVRTGDVFGMPEYLRITTGTPSQCEGFIKALKHVFAELGVG